MIHVIIDSTAGVPQAILDKNPNVHVVSLSIALTGEYVPEHEITVDEVINYSEATKKAIPTSQPSTGDFLNIINAIPKEDPIIIICLTSAVSGTYNGALLAARQSGRKNICVIDSRTTAIGMVQMLQDALELIAENKSFEEIANELEKISFRMQTSFTVDNLDYLVRGGRVGKAVGLIGSILKIRPVVYINKDNEVDEWAKVRTAKKATLALLDLLHKHSPCKRIGVVHIQNEEGGRALQAMVQAEYPDIEVTLTSGTPVLTCYLGPGLTGIIFESAE